jgi:putative spermidine/putrescine transport system ATP-binding protein
VTRSPPYERQVNTVFQDYALFPHMNVLDNVAYGLRVQGVSKRERRERAAEALQMVRLPRVEARRPIQLSGGQRQRVALARAIINRPRVLLLDEPLGALDLKLRQEMQLELKAIQRELSERITFLYVTHDQDEALTMSDRIAVFSQGRVEQVGTPGDVYERPANEFVAGFVGASNILERGGRRVLVRPEKIRILAEGEPDVGAVAGVVREVAYLGSVTRFVVELDEGATLIVLRQNLDMSAAQARQERGRRVRLSWRPQDASVLDSNQQEGSK